MNTIDQFAAEHVTPTASAAPVADAPVEQPPQIAGDQPTASPSTADVLVTDAPPTAPPADLDLADVIAAPGQQPPTLTDADRQWRAELFAVMARYLDAGNRLTLLGRNGKDFKAPLRKGYLDPAVNVWTLDTLTGHLQWADAQWIDVTGFGVVQGSISGNRYTLDLDKGEFYGPVREVVQKATGFDLDTLPRVRSGRTTGIGYHVVFRSTKSVPKEDLVKVPEGTNPDGTTRYKAAVELKAEGSQVVAPPSRHKSGRVYTVERGGDVYNPPVIDFETVERIIAAIRTLNQEPPRPRPEPRPKPATSWEPRPGDYSPLDVINRFKAENDIETVLAQHGYEQTGADAYKHPNGGDNDASVRILDHGAYFFSPNDPMRGPTFGDAFDVVVALDYHGDKARAIRELSERYGMRRAKSEPINGDWSKGRPELPEDDLLADAAQPPQAPTPPTLAPGPSSTRPTVILESFDEVQAKPIDWIWPGRLARGKLTLICGDPGKGKSFLSLDIAARVTTGTPFPDGHTPRVGSVLLITDEDDSADTIKPRLLAMGANPAKVKRLKSVMLDGKPGDFTLGKVAALYDVIRQCPDLALIVIDPLMSYFGKTKSADPAEVNALLGQLNTFAADTGIAVEALVHLNKDSKSGNALYRSMGSISVIGKARLAFLVAPDRDNPERRVLAQSKANAAAFVPSLSFQIVPTSVTEAGAEINTARVQWHGAIDVSADDLLGSPAETSSRQSAEDFLREYLVKPTPSDEVKEEADRRGISFRTLMRAKEKLGIKARKEGVRGGWTWQPVGEAPQAYTPPVKVWGMEDDRLA